MTGEVVLSSALRANLLSLQRTQSNIDKVQNVLATGLKVASALDNPQSFFASQALKNRSGDLSRLLDGMGQSIQTIKQADQGVTSLTKLIDQAESLATEAQSAINSGGAQAAITGDRVFKLTQTMVGGNIAADDNVTFSVTDKNGDAVTITGGGTVTIAATDTVEEFIAGINAMKDADGNQVVQASLNSDGHLEIKSLAGGDMRMAFADTGAAAKQSLASGLGLGDYTVAEYSGTAGANAATGAAITVSSSPVLSSFSLYKADGSVADRSTALQAAYKSDLTTRVANMANAGDGFVVGVNGQRVTLGAGSATTYTVQNLVDGINNSASLNGQIQASFDETSGEIQIRAIASDVKTLQIGATASTANASTVNLGFGTQSVSSGATAAFVGTESIAFGQGAGQLAQMEKDFNDIRTQIDQLVKDSGYRGVNLLAGDTLTTYFNEDRSSSMSVSGQRLDTSETGLNINEAVFSTAQNISDSLAAIRGAKEQVRNFGSLLSNGLSVIQTREDFTKSTIQTLNEGSDKLTLADQNEEGAKLLALQTRQQLGVTALSLAAQAQQSVLRLF